MVYFRSEKNNIYTVAPITKFYIPKDYFSNKVKPFAEDRGRTIHVFGVFDVGFFNEGKDGEDRLIEYNILKIPTWVDINVVDSSEETLQVGTNKKEQKYVVLTYPKGSNIMDNRVVKDAENAESYLGMVIAGSLPSTIPYDKLLAVWQENLSLNKADLGVQSVNLELILSTSCRYEGNPIEKFSEALAKNPQLGMNDYIMNSAREVCKNTSTFTAITFEDIDSMLISSINRTTHKEQEKESPVEQLLKL